MKIVVTGGTGMVGAHLLVQLMRGENEVVAIKRPTSSTADVQHVFEHYGRADDFSKIVWEEADILDVLALESVFTNADIVYHAAAMVSFVPSDYDSLIKQNVEGTANVVNACLSSDVKTLAYVSSTAAIGRQLKVDIVTEDLPWDEKGNASGYSISKHYAEREVWRGSEEGLNVSIVNPCIVVGPGKWGSSSTTLLDSAYNEIAFYSTGANAFVDARDVASVLIRLVEKNQFNERYLVIGENMSFKTFFTKTAKLFGKRPPHIKTSKWLTGLACRVAWLASKFTGKKPEITKETAQSAQRITTYSSEKLKSVLPDFSFRSVDEAIENATEAYLTYRVTHE